MAQGIAEMKRGFQAEQCQAVTTRHAKVQQQRLLAAGLHHPRHMGGQQGAICGALGAIEYRQPPKAGVAGYWRQAFAQAPHQPCDLTGARAIGDKVPRPGTHGIEHQLVVHAIAQGDDCQHRFGFQHPLDQCALIDHLLTIQPHEHQTGKGDIDQRQQLVKAAAAGAHHLPQGRQRTLQPLQVAIVAGNGKEGLAQVFTHRDNPLRRSKSLFSRNTSRPRIGSCAIGTCGAVHGKAQSICLITRSERLLIEGHPCLVREWAVWLDFRG
ncbi:hypothetical protein D3C80_571250 [compost metagenome]